MVTDDEESDLIAEMERMDRFFDGEEPGDIPLEFLRQRGIDIPALAPDDDGELRAKLQKLIEEMFEIGIIVDFTDHLSERDLYRYLVDDVLLVETMLSTSVGGPGISARSVAGARKTTSCIFATTRMTRIANGAAISAIRCLPKRSRRTVAIDFRSSSSRREAGLGSAVVLRGHRSG